jgi:hypothetical protein
MMGDIYILGAGVNGLILGFLLDATVIGTDSECQSRSSFPLGPRILHYDAAAAYLLHKLNMFTAPRKFKIGHYDEGKFVTPTPEFKARYVKKTRGEDIKIDSAMSSDKTEILGWDISEIKLIEALEQQVNIIRSMVTYIDTEHKYFMLDSETAVRYDELISTIKLPKLFELTGVPYPFGTLEANPTTFVLCRGGFMRDANIDFSYIYVADTRYMFNRVTFLDNGCYVVEFPGAISEPWRLLKGSEVLEYKIVNKCQILPPYAHYDSVHGIQLQGRYAKWQHGILINDVIKAGIKGCTDYARWTLMEY